MREKQKCKWYYEDTKIKGVVWYDCNNKENFLHVCANSEKCTEYK